MAIQVWDVHTQQYVDSDLARFSAAGALTEALSWENGQYVKVWPNEPTPITGTFHEIGVGEAARMSTVHTFVDPGMYEINLTLTPPVLTYAAVSLVDWDSQVLYARATGTAYGLPSSVTAQVEVPAGAQVQLRMNNPLGGGGSTVISGTWSITKI